MFAALSLGAGTADNSSTIRSLAQSIGTSNLSQSASRSVSRHMESIRKKFEEKGLVTQAVRNNEVIKITIPASDLFGPNETMLKTGADKILGYFRQAVNHPESYRILVAVYADDTGDAQYSTALTKERAMNVAASLRRLATSQNTKPNIDYYWFGNTEFAVPNTTMTNRAKNRRVEIYLVPEKHIIEASRAS